MSTTTMTELEKMNRDADRAVDLLNQMSDKQLDELFPLRQKSNTGLYGWERVYDSVNLNRCVFRSQKAARADRRKNLFTAICPEWFIEWANGQGK